MRLLFENKSTKMIRKALDNKIIELLMDILNDDELTGVSDKNLCKVNAIKILKIIESEKKYASEIADYFNQYENWEQYKYQKADLFISKNEKKDKFISKTVEVLSIKDSNKQ